MVPLPSADVAGHLTGAEHSHQETPLHLIGKGQCPDLCGRCKERLELAMGVEIAPAPKPTDAEMVRFHPWWNQNLERLLHRAFGEIIHRITVSDRAENEGRLS
jgi:hypothetical protein